MSRECASGLSFYYQQLHALRVVRQEKRLELLAEGKKRKVWNGSSRFLRSIRSGQPCLGILQTPHRFRTKRQLASGFGIEIQSGADHRSVDG
jgi:hypothetical protein